MRPVELSSLEVLVYTTTGVELFYGLDLRVIRLIQEPKMRDLYAVFRIQLNIFDQIISIGLSPVSGAALSVRYSAKRAT
jgi:hypothetical protein